MMAAAIPIYENRHVPLVKEHEDGTQREVLCWVFGGVIHVRPERVPAFRAWTKNHDNREALGMVRDGTIAFRTAAEIDALTAGANA